MAEQYAIAPGTVYGRWTVVKQIDSTRYLCHCVCGRDKVTLKYRLINGTSASCGCVWATHRQSFTSEYRIWCAIKQRCYNPNCTGYRNYGARGVTMCDRWTNSFEAFYSDIGPRPSKNHSIDRFPNNKGNYEPGNCRWATATEQLNNVSYNRHVVFNGVSRTLAEWSRVSGISPDTIGRRLNAGLDPHSAIFNPSRSRKPWRSRD
jgi:hypothetical protein